MSFLLQAILRPGLGYCGAWATLRSEFAPLNHKRVYQLWKQMRLGLHPKPKKRRTGTPMPDAPTAPNQVWCLDFVHDTCLIGTQLKILAVIDEFTRECLALEAATSIKSKKVRAILADIMKERGTPQNLRSDNGPEFIAHSLTIWLALQGTTSKFIKPGSPWMNGKAESLNGKLRAEFLNSEIFYNLADAQVKMRIFQKFYNEERPHSSIGYLSPTTFKKSFQESTIKEELYS